MTRVFDARAWGRAWKLLLLAPLMGLAAACASGLGSDDFERRESGQIAPISEGVIVNYREVVVEGTESGVGAAAGGAAGGVIGSTIGGDGFVGSALGAIAGSVIGGVGGAAAEEAVTRQRAFAYTIRLTDGSGLISITQPDDQPIPVDTVVYIERGSERARIVGRE